MDVLFRSVVRNAAVQGDAIAELSIVAIFFVFPFSVPAVLSQSSRSPTLAKASGSLDKPHGLCQTWREWHRIILFFFPLWFWIWMKRGVRLMFVYIGAVLGPSRIHRSTIITLSMRMFSHADTNVTQVNGAVAKRCFNREGVHRPSCHNAWQTPS